MSTAIANSDRRSVATRLSAPLTLLLSIAAVAIGLSPTLSELLQFDAPAILAGELWRFLTGHLAHWNLEHLFWDVSVFVVLGTMCECRSRAAFLACVLGSAIAISCYTLIALPEMPIYRGLSGIDTGLVTLLGVSLFADARRSGNRPMQWIIAAATLGLISKTVFEFAQGGSVFVDHTAAAFVPIPMAHVLGAAVSLIVGFAITAWDCDGSVHPGSTRAVAQSNVPFFVDSERPSHVLFDARRALLPCSRDRSHAD